MKSIICDNLNPNRELKFVAMLVQLNRNIISSSPTIMKPPDRGVVIWKSEEAWLGFGRAVWKRIFDNKSARKMRKVSIAVSFADGNMGWTKSPINKR